MDYVTTLIGLSRNKLAYAGIMSAPFKKIDKVQHFMPTISIGVV